MADGAALIAMPIGAGRRSMLRGKLSEMAKGLRCTYMQCYARTLRSVNNRLDYLLRVIESTFNDIKVAQLR